MVRVTKAKAIDRLQQLLDEASEVHPEDGHSKGLLKWLQDVDNSMLRIFGEESRHYSWLPGSYTVTTPGIAAHLNTVISVVESSLDDIKWFWEDVEEVHENVEEKNEFSTIDLAQRQKGSGSKRVFVIHGRDKATRETVARFLDQLELDPIILHEQPNEGRTIIEKIEAYADVGFAVVLLTPDDVGRLVTNENEFMPRARQNVILELGYFLGKLGRERVCVLKKRGVETPSDYDGVVYTELDAAGAWKMELFQELKRAGMDVDANRAFRS